jgi:hypothetical protein
METARPRRSGGASTAAVATRRDQNSPCAAAASVLLASATSNVGASAVSAVANERAPSVPARIRRLGRRRVHLTSGRLRTATVTAHAETNIPAVDGFTPNPSLMGRRTLAGRSSAVTVTNAAADSFKSAIHGIGVVALSARARVVLVMRRTVKFDTDGKVKCRTDRDAHRSSRRS